MDSDTIRLPTFAQDLNDLAGEMEIMSRPSVDRSRRFGCPTDPVESIHRFDFVTDMKSETNMTRSKSGDKVMDEVSGQISAFCKTP